MPTDLAPFAMTHPVNRTPAIWAEGTSREAYAVMLFRRRFALKRAVARAAVWISASQRFMLYVDGRLVGRGPSRSDPQRWHVAKVPLGKLAAGRHVLAVRVVNWAGQAGIGQMGGSAFLLVRGAGALEGVVDTSEQWKCLAETARTPLPEHAWAGKRPYFVVGAGERFDAGKAVWGWQEPRFDDKAWAAAKVVCPQAADPWGNVPLGCLLYPEPLPAMEEAAVDWQRVAAAPEQMRAAAEAFVRDGKPLRIGAHQTVRMVLDAGAMTNAYPTLAFSGGKGARIGLVWAEAGYGPDRTKTDRNDIAGKQMLGFGDQVLPDGRPGRAWTPLWFRAFRYVEVTIKTGGSPLTLDGLALTFTGYPLRQRAVFEVPPQEAPAYQRIWDVSWRTARLCAHETFFDCPHYEQAQFPGDTRVQAIYHYLVANDDRLARKAIDDFAASRIVEGLTQCRYPSRQLQILPTFSLLWIGMLHDFRRYRGDAAFLAPYLPMARGVMEWFLRHRRGDGMLGFVPYAPFVDWTPAFACGNAPQEADGGSAILTLLLATTARQLAGLETLAGMRELGSRWEKLAGDLARAAVKRCWDARRGLLADTPAKRSFSQHAQIEAILAGAWPAAKGRAVLSRALADGGVAGPGTFYYRFYLMQALKAVGLRERFLGILPRWHQVLDATNLTTWPETDSQPRSDCHAWSVAPVIELFETVLGLEPAGDGFGGATLEPALGPLAGAAGRLATPAGVWEIGLERQGRWIEGRVRCPVAVHVVPLGRRLGAGSHRLRWAVS